MKFGKVMGVSERGFLLFSTVEVEDEFCEEVSSRRGSAHFFYTVSCLRGIYLFRRNVFEFD